VAWASLLLGVVLPGAAAASPGNGELCSVQTEDTAVRTSVYAYPSTDSATSEQIDHAGAWCTKQINVAGWTGANKNYDAWEDQEDVCQVHFDGADVVLDNFADPDDNDAVQEAAQGCSEIAGGDLSIITFWP